MFKFRGTSFDAALPLWVYCMWSVIATFWLLGFYIAFRNGSKQQKIYFDPYNPEVEIVKHGKKLN